MYYILPFFLAHWTCVNFFGRWTKMICRILFLPICISRIYRVYIFSKSIDPSSHHSRPPPLRLPQKWSAQQIVEFPTSHTCISFVTQHVLYVPVIRNYNISGQMHVLCIRNLVTYAGTVVVLQVLSKWSLLKIRGLWAMGFSNISGHHSIFGSDSLVLSVAVFVYYNYWWWEITSKLTF